MARDTAVNLGGLFIKNRSAVWTRSMQVTSAPATTLDTAGGTAASRRLHPLQATQILDQRREDFRTSIEDFIEQYYNRQRLHSALRYRSPEEFERQSEWRSSAADSRSATMEFFENDENEMRASTELAGEGDSIAAPFPGPHLLLGDTRKAE